MKSVTQLTCVAGLPVGQTSRSLRARHVWRNVGDGIAEAVLTLAVVLGAHAAPAPLAG